MTKRRIHIKIDEATTSFFRISGAGLPHEAPRAPHFPIWLAERRPKAWSMNGQAELLEWIGETWDDDLVAPLIKAIDERNTAADHAFMAVKRGSADDDGCVIDDDLWQLGQTQALSRSRIITTIFFKRTRRFLNTDLEDEAEG